MDRNKTFVDTSIMYALQDAGQGRLREYDQIVYGRLEEVCTYASIEYVVSSEQ